MANQWRFTFSLRSEEDHFAVVSYARMDPARLGGRTDAERLKTRLRKMVAKNIGIMYYGLPISQDPRSVLYGQIGGVRELDEMPSSSNQCRSPSSSSGSAAVPHQCCRRNQPKHRDCRFPDPSFDVVIEARIALRR
jgi:hypothetical protein